MNAQAQATPTGTSADAANAAGKRVAKANERKTATTKARKDATPMPDRAWLVAMLDASGDATWVSVSAPGMKRAAKAARKQAKGRVLGVVEAVLKGTKIG